MSSFILPAQSGVTGHAIANCECFIAVKHHRPIETAVRVGSAPLDDAVHTNVRWQASPAER